MRKYLVTLALLMVGLSHNAMAQYLSVIHPPHGGVRIVSGGYYTAGTVFANGMAYPGGATVQRIGAVTRAIYSAPVLTQGYYPIIGNRVYQATNYNRAYSQINYLNPGYSSYNSNFGIGGYDYNRIYQSIGSRMMYPVNYGLNNFRSSYSTGYLANPNSSRNRGYRRNRR